MAGAAVVLNISGHAAESVSTSTDASSSVTTPKTKKPRAAKVAKADKPKERKTKLPAKDGLEAKAPGEKKRAKGATKKKTDGLALVFQDASAVKNGKFDAKSINQQLSKVKAATGQQAALVLMVGGPAPDKKQKKKTGPKKVQADAVQKK